MQFARRMKLAGIFFGGPNNITLCKGGTYHEKIICLVDYGGISALWRQCRD
jgi:hypothetical protein